MEVRNKKTTTIIPGKLPSGKMVLNYKLYSIPSSLWFSPRLFILSGQLVPLFFFLFLSLKLSYEKLSLKTSTFLSFFSYSQLIFFCPSNPNTNLQLSQIFFPLEPLPFSRSALIPNHHPILWFSISLISCSPSYQRRSPLSPKLRSFV